VTDTPSATPIIAGAAVHLPLLLRLH
jgi:hypothetical protein